jgi:hypothetical protein
MIAHRIDDPNLSEMMIYVYRLLNSYVHKSVMLCRTLSTSVSIKSKKDKFSTPVEHHGSYTFRSN